MNLLDRIANYFKEWDGVDETAPKMELSIHDLRYIASMNVERCRLLKEINEANKRIAEYKESEENGLLLKLPCKVGTKVYHIHTLPRTNRKVIGEVDADAFFLTLCVIEGRFGKSAFLTQEEAQNALTELSN